MSAKEKNEVNEVEDDAKDIKYATQPIQIDVVSLDGNIVGDIFLSGYVFGVKTPRVDILHKMVVYQRAKKQLGTHKTKTRGEIALSGRKFVRQKGSGGARHGSRKVGQFRKGGKAFGPVVHSHAISLPQKFRKMALRHALSLKLQDKQLTILEEACISSPKTKDIFLHMIPFLTPNCLVIDTRDANNANFRLSVRNIPGLNCLAPEGLNVYDVLLHKNLILTKNALSYIERRFVL